MAARATPVERWAGFSLLCAAGRLEVPGLAVAVRGRGAPPGCGRTLLERQPFIHHTREKPQGGKGLLSHVSRSRTCGLGLWCASRRMPSGEESLLVLWEVQITGWNAAEPARNLRKNLETGTLTGFELSGWREMVLCCE